jgi:hypothetical protein
MHASRTDICAYKKDGADGAKSGPAYLTRCGVFSYVYPNGQVVNELRHPQDVFAKDSLRTLESAPVVIGHPNVITSENWKQYAIGHVGDDVDVDGIYVASEVHVQDAAAVAALGTDALELSCGYACVVVPEVGTFDGIEYQARQTQIRYNHVGMGPAGWGRAGESVRIYFDANKENPVHYAQGCYGDEMHKQFLPVNRMDSAMQNPAPQAPALGGTELNTVSRADHDALRGELAASKARNAELEAAHNDAAQRASVRVRMDLLRVAEAQGLESEKLDTLSDDAIRCAVLNKVRPDIKTESEPPEYIRAAFDFARKADGNAKQAAKGEAPPVVDKTDSEPIGSKIETVRADAIKKARNAWKEAK